MDKHELIRKLILFKNKAFCSYSLYSAGQVWRNISGQVPQPYRDSISIEWQHLQLGHGNDTCIALNNAVDRFIKSII